MKVLRVFFLGLIYGWFMRWIIDEIFLKDQYRIITNENAQLRDRIALLERPRPLETRPILQPESPPLVETGLRTPPPTSMTRSKPVASTRTQKDDLKLIKGIGPQMEKKLNNAGVMTFEQMSRLTSTELQNILGISKRVVQSSDNLLTQARQLAQKKTKK